MGQQEWVKRNFSVAFSPPILEQLDPAEKHNYGSNSIRLYRRAVPPSKFPLPPIIAGREPRRLGPPSSIALPASFPIVTTHRSLLCFLLRPGNFPTTTDRLLQGIRIEIALPSGIPRYTQTRPFFRTQTRDKRNDPPKGPWRPVGVCGQTLGLTLLLADVRSLSAHPRRLMATIPLLRRKTTKWLLNHPLTLSSHQAQCPLLPPSTLQDRR